MTNNLATVPEIVTYDPLYRQYFIDLNLVWLKRYFKVEPHDTNVFDRLEEVILEPGGEIFFCKYGDQIVGTVAMQKADDTTFELCKMAVADEYQGRGFSNLLMNSCIEFARSKKASKIFLMSNSVLKPALSLYSKFGFKEVPVGETDYERADYQMELLLS